jgi:hypothetical protein
MPIEKSSGQTRTEQLLSELCDQTFLKLWSYSNPFKSDGKELCDLIAIFDDHVFLMFDRESRKFDTSEKDVLLTWERWKKEVVDKQIKTAEGAKRYVSGQQLIYLDARQRIPLPVKISPQRLKVHKIVVAHGAAEACKNFSPDNIYGSLAISYAGDKSTSALPFMLDLDKVDPVHVFDSHNLEIVLRELDTVEDFVQYIVAKEDAIRRYDFLLYCGEEDLLAHYFFNFDQQTKKHRIGTADSKVNSIMVGEGEWQDFVGSKQYKLKKEADKVSYLWDEIIQRTCDNALKGTLIGTADAFDSRSAIYEMAKEPRFSRRALSENMIRAIQNFPENLTGLARNLSFMPSFFPETGYVFLQIKHPNISDYDNEYRPRRQAVLQIACGAAKNKFPHLKKVVGIAIDAPKFTDTNSEDFLLLECENWSTEDATQFHELNKDWKFFETGIATTKTVRNFPLADEVPGPKKKLGRNDKCPCGSGEKYKHCCLR